MNRYRFPAPRPMLGLAAMALAAATLSIAVALPASSQVAGANALGPARVAEVVRIEPSRIVVIGSRETVIADDRAAERPAS